MTPGRPPILSVFGLALALLAPLAACSAPPGRPTETGGEGEDGEARVAVVDLERVIAETDAGQAAMEQFERMGRRMQADLDARREELEEMQEAIQQAQEDGAEEEALAGMLTEYQQKAGLAQQLFATSQQQLDALRDQLTAPILEDVARIVRRIGREENFDLIVERKGLAWVEPDADLTARVIELYGDELGGDSEPSVGAGELRLMGGLGAGDEDEGDGDDDSEDSETDDSDGDEEAPQE